MTNTVALNLASPVATLTLQRPPLNAISVKLIEDIDAALDAVIEAGDVTVLRIRSAAKAFCAGADLVSVREIMEAADPSHEMLRFVGRFHELNNRIASLDIVTIAEIEGAAVGGGLEVAMACDFRVATVRARLGLPEAKLGLIPAAGGTFRLRQIAGMSVARRLILRGEIISAKEAFSCGLVDSLVDPSEVDDAAAFEAFASEIAGNSHSAVVAAKHCLATPVEQGQAIETSKVAALILEDETQSRIRKFLGQ